MTTSVVGYLTSRPSRDMVIAAHQELTRQWWDERSEKYELLVSELVRQEASQGDPEAASERMGVLNTLSVLQISGESLRLAELLVNEGPIPRQSSADALHIAVAALNGIDYLLTWNCKHLANATHRHRLETMIEDAGYACPIICTPEELMKFGVIVKNTLNSSTLTSRPWSRTYRRRKKSTQIDLFPSIQSQLGAERLPSTMRTKP